MSLRLKISVLSAFITGAILLGFGAAAWRFIARERLAEVDREIRTLTARHPGWLANRGNYDRLTSMLAFTFGEDRKDQVILWIRDNAGPVLYQSPHWPADLDPLTWDLSLARDPKATIAQDSADVEPAEHRGPGQGWGRGPGPGAGPGYGWGRAGQSLLTRIPRLFTARAGATAWRLGAFGNEATTLVLGINYDDVHRQLRRLRNNFLLTIPFALALAAFGGWLIGNRASRPLRAIAETAANVTARGLDQRIIVSRADPEMACVVDVLNGMMDRLEKSFHQATRFTADASHELKTPLTIMQGELENALQSAAPESPEQRVFTNLLEETHRLKGITRNLLLLAQADAGQLKLSREPVDISATVDALVEDARILGADLGLKFEISAEPGLFVQADRVLLETAFMNLLTNAVRYNEPDGRVSVRLGHDDKAVILAIGNTGPGILSQDQPRVFERFYRSRQTAGQTADGTGLGLSLAREIIRAHGGELTLEESRPGWTRFMVRV
jgi:two-component system, OmpR family, heavy metal sensor histidine kinase CusS